MQRFNFDFHALKRINGKFSFGVYCNEPRSKNELVSYKIVLQFWGNGEAWKRSAEFDQRLKESTFCEPLRGSLNELINDVSGRAIIHGLVIDDAQVQKYDEIACNLVKIRKNAFAWRMSVLQMVEGRDNLVLPSVEHFAASEGSKPSIRS